MIELFIIIGILLTFGLIFYFLYYRENKEREKVNKVFETFEKTIEDIVSANSLLNKTFFDKTEKIQEDNFKQLDKQSFRQLEKLEKQTKVFTERTDSILKTFENTVSQVLTSVEKTNNKFYEMSAKIQMEHFKQLEKQSANILGAMDEQADKFVELLRKPEPVIQRIEDVVPIENIIEKEDNTENPLEEVTNIPIKEGIQVQFDGEEEIIPINIS